MSRRGVRFTPRSRSLIVRARACPLCQFLLGHAVKDPVAPEQVPERLNLVESRRFHAVASTSATLYRRDWEASGLLCVVGRLQEAIGLASAMVLSYLLRVPAALLALYVLSKNRASLARSLRRRR